MRWKCSGPTETGLTGLQSKSHTTKPRGLVREGSRLSRGGAGAGGPGASAHGIAVRASPPRTQPNREGRGVRSRPSDRKPPCRARVGAQLNPEPARGVAVATTRHCARAARRPAERLIFPRRVLSIGRASRGQAVLRSPVRPRRVFWSVWEKFPSNLAIPVSWPDGPPIRAAVRGGDAQAQS